MTEVSREPGVRRSQRTSGKVANAVVALGAAAVLVVYSAGYLKTRAAAERFESTAAARKPAIVEPAAAAPRTTSTSEPAPAIPAPPAGTVTRGPAESTLTPDRALQPQARDTSARSNSLARPIAAQPSAADTRTQAPPAAASGPPTGATETPAETAAPATPEATEHYADGTFLGWGSCRHGTIQASVVIEDGRIVSSAIASCRTRYSCSWVSALPGQVVDRQSAEVDYVSGATESVDAFYGAVVEALSHAAAAYPDRGR